LETVEKINQLTDSVNDTAAEVFNLEKLTLMNSTVIGITAQIPQDWYIRDGFIMELKDDVLKERHVWLLSTSIIVCRVSRMRKKEHFLRRIGLDRETSIDCKDDQLEFEISSSDGTTSKFVCSNSTTFTQWVTDIKNLIVNKEFKSPRSRLFVVSDDVTKRGKKNEKKDVSKSKRTRQKFSSR